MDDKTALAVWTQFRDRMPTTGVTEASALLQFTKWVQDKATPQPPDADPDKVSAVETASEVAERTSREDVAV